MCGCGKKSVWFCSVYLLTNCHASCFLNIGWAPKAAVRFLVWSDAWPGGPNLAEIQQNFSSVLQSPLPCFFVTPGWLEWIWSGLGILDPRCKGNGRSVPASLAAKLPLHQLYTRVLIFSLNSRMSQLFLPACNTNPGVGNHAMFPLNKARCNVAPRLQLTQHRLLVAQVSQTVEYVCVEVAGIRDPGSRLLCDAAEWNSCVLWCFHWLQYNTEEMNRNNLLPTNCLIALCFNCFAYKHSWQRDRAGAPRCRIPTHSTISVNYKCYVDSIFWKKILNPGWFQQACTNKYGSVQELRSTFGPWRLHRVLFKVLLGLIWSGQVWFDCFWLIYENWDIQKNPKKTRMTCRVATQLKKGRRRGNKITDIFFANCVYCLVLNELMILVLYP